MVHLKPYPEIRVWYPEIRVWVWVLCYPFVEVNSLTEHHLSFLFDGDYCFADYAHIKFNLSIVVSLRMTFVMKILKFVLGQYINFNALHNEAKSPSRVHFWDLCNIYDFKPIFGVFHAWRPQNNTQSDVDHYLLSLP